MNSQEVDIIEEEEPPPNLKRKKNRRIPIISIRDVPKPYYHIKDPMVRKQFQAEMPTLIKNTTFDFITGRRFRSLGIDDLGREFVLELDSDQSSFSSYPSGAFAVTDDDDYDDDANPIFRTPQVRKPKMVVSPESGETPVTRGNDGRANTLSPNVIQALTVWPDLVNAPFQTTHTQNV